MSFKITEISDYMQKKGKNRLSTSFSQLNQLSLHTFCSCPWYPLAFQGECPRYKYSPKEEIYYCSAKENPTGMCHWAGRPWRKDSEDDDYPD